MNQPTIQVLFALLRSAICGSQLSEEERVLYANNNMLPDLMAISKKHDIAHLIVAGLGHNSLLPETDDSARNELYSALYRCTRLNYEYKRLSDCLENANIAFIPLKGQIIQAYYPETWMRTRCDIDILVYLDELEEITSYLKTCGYSYLGKGPHDISLLTPNKKHIELHYELVNTGDAGLANDILKSVWETSTPSGGHRCCYTMSDEIFYFYHIAHMAKHFEKGGCGIRPFIDLWFLDKGENADMQARDELLEKGKLLTFANTARQLSKVWLDNAEHDDVTKQMEQFVLRGGVYGSMDNRVMLQQQKRGANFGIYCHGFSIRMNISSLIILA